jgi:hypothetical protein
MSDVDNTQLPLRNALLQKLAALIPDPSSTRNVVTSGVSRQVRHTGVYITNPSSNTRTANKEALRMVAGQVC